MDFLNLLERVETANPRVRPRHDITSHPSTMVETYYSTHGGPHIVQRIWVRVFDPLVGGGNEHEHLGT